MKTVQVDKAAQGLDGSKAAIDELVARIVKTVHPLKVILFGSRARGDARPDSDWDLAVVMPDGTHRRHTRQKIYLARLGVDIPYDLWVATPGDFKRYGDHPSLAYKYILEDGVVLYQRRNGKPGAAV